MCVLGLSNEIPSTFASHSIFEHQHILFGTKIIWTVYLVLPVLKAAKEDHSRSEPLPHNFFGFCHFLEDQLY